MPTLLLMRHAKAVADDPDGDHARPLSGRGHDEAVAAGREIARQGPPDFALVSDARRTRETLAGVMAGSGLAIPHRIEPRLYGASPEGILALVRATAPAVERLLVIGHNPGIGDLARRLAASGERAAQEHSASGFPTSTVAILTFDTVGWSDLAGGGPPEALGERA